MSDFSLVKLSVDGRGSASVRVTSQRAGGGGGGGGGAQSPGRVSQLQ